MIQFTEEHNKTIQRKEATLLKEQRTSDDKGNLFEVVQNKMYLFNPKRIPEASKINIEKVFFIVSDLTASASEQLINCIKDFVPTTIIGKDTYGKTVSHFPIIIDKYEVCLVSAYITNSSTNPIPKNGLLVSPGCNVDEELKYDFGDPEEKCLKKALELIE